MGWGPKACISQDFKVRQSSDQFATVSRWVASSERVTGKAYEWSVSDEQWEVLEQEQSGERAKMALKVHSSLWTVILLSNRINFHVSKFSTSIWILTPSKHDYVGPTCVRHAPHQRIWKLTKCRCDVICSLVWQQPDISMTGRLLIRAF